MEIDNIEGLLKTVDDLTNLFPMAKRTCNKKSAKNVCGNNEYSGLHFSVLLNYHPIM